VTEAENGMQYRTEPSDRRPLAQAGGEFPVGQDVGDLHYAGFEHLHARAPDPSQQGIGARAGGGKPAREGLDLHQPLREVTAGTGHKSSVILEARVHY